MSEIEQPFWIDRPVLVTGATGLVGSALVRELIDQRADVVALVRDWVPHSELVRANNLEKIKVVRGDICDLPLLERVLGEYEIDTVFHLGAQTIVGVANRNPLSTFESNIAGTWNALEACRRSPKVNQVVVASSDKAYGCQDQLPYDEDMPLQGKYPYDCSKSCADLIANCYAQSYEVPVCVTRCGNFYGPGDLNYNRLIPGTIRSVLRNQRPVIRSDGQFVRDYIYVDDGALAYMTTAQALATDMNLRGAAFNFSYEQPMTVLEVVAEILEIMDRKDLQPVVHNQASNEIPKQFLSSQKAKQMLGWSPKYNLRVGLEKTVAWYTQVLSTAQHSQADLGHVVS